MIAQPRRIRPNDVTRSILQEREIDVLASIAWAGILSTSQVMHLHFPSRRKAQRRLRALLDHRLVRAALQAEMLHKDTLWRLTTRGAALLVELGRTADEVKPGPLPRFAKLAHALAIRDVFVAFCLAEREGNFVLEDFRFDDELSHAEPFRSARVIPDGLATLRHGDIVTRIGIEVDRGSQPRRVIDSKLSAWRPLIGPAVVELLVVAPSQRRADAIALIASRVGVARRTHVVTPSSLAATIRRASWSDPANGLTFRAAAARL